MHILVPTGIFHPEAGGPATYLYRFLPELLERGHTVEVVTFSDAAGTEDYPYPVKRIPRSNLVKRNWQYYQAVRERLPTADKVFVNSLGLVLPRIKQPMVMKIVGDRAWERAVNRGWVPATEDVDHFQTARYSPLVNWLKRSRSQETKNADYVIVPSDYLRQMVIGWGMVPERVQTIYNALEPSADNISMPTDLPTDGTLLLTAARLTPWKGVDVTIEAMAALPTLHLIVAGDGPSLPSLQALAQNRGLAERVHFLGRVSREVLAGYYRAADYVVLYSGYEGLSHVILEALNAGTPVIASDKGGNPEIVRDGENGFLVPYRDVDALRATLARAIDTQLPHQTLIDRERFAWERLTAETIAVLEREQYP